MDLGTHKKRTSKVSVVYRISNIQNRSKTSGSACELLIHYALPHSVKIQNAGIAQMQMKNKMVSKRIKNRQYRNPKTLILSSKIPECFLLMGNKDSYSKPKF